MRLIMMALTIVLLAGMYNPVLAQDSDTLYVKDIVLTTNVVDREPTDTVDAFTSANDQAFCHIRVFNNGEPSQIMFKWFHNDTEYFKFTANIGTSPSWRTYTSVIPKRGDWRVEILDSNGNILSQKSFKVTK